MFSVHTWSSRDQPWGQWTWHQESIAYYKIHLEWGKHNTWFLLKLPEDDRTSAISWLLLSGLPNKKVPAFSTGESLNESLCSLPGLTQCQSVWLWSASGWNPSLEGWLAAMGDSSKFLSRLCKTHFISFWLLLRWCFTKSSQWIFSELALSPCGFYINFLYH